MTEPLTCKYNTIV